MEKVKRKKKGLNKGNPVTKHEMWPKIHAIFGCMGIGNKQIRDITNMFLDLMAEGLAQGRGVDLRNFGQFHVVEYPERMKNDPWNPGKQVLVPSHRKVKFRPSRLLKVALNGAERIGVRQEEEDLPDDLG